MLMILQGFEIFELREAFQDNNYEAQDRLKVH